MTYDERFLLHLLDTGEEDGVVKIFYDARKYIVGYEITCGIPAYCEAKPIKKIVKRELKIVDYETPKAIKEYRTDEERLLFLKKFGHYMRDEVFQEYSRSSGLAIILPKSPREIERESKARRQECKPSEMTEIELHLLSRLAAGEFDGYEGSYWWPNSIYWCTIENGTPIRWKQGPGSTVFNGEENERIPGKTSVYKRYVTDDEKLEFFRKFGRDMNDQEAFDYSWEARKKKYNLR